MIRSSIRVIVILLAFLSISLEPATKACSQEVTIAEIYNKESAMIPMRDGVRLYTEIYTPVDQVEPLPIIFLRTPYGTKNGTGGFTGYFQSTFRELAKDRYIFAVQDARGRHLSEGQFEWNRPVRHRKDPTAIDASTDAFDSIDWLVKNAAPNNGRVGMLGVSYPGWYVAMALIDPHPALKAASPQASPSDYFLGDDFYHFGAFRLSPSAELPYLFDFDPKANSRFPYDQVDTYEFFLELGPLSNMNAKYLKDASPTWNNFLKHATYDKFWEEGSTLQHFQSIAVPTLHVVGWWDAENLGGALDLYKQIEKHDRDNLSTIVVGPWAHGQWARGPSDRLGNYRFGSDTVSFYQKEIEAPFFSFHLKDKGEYVPPEAFMFQTGSNEWRKYTQWPPLDQVDKVRFYCHASGVLSNQLDEEAQQSFTEFVSDPAKPVPYSKRPIMGFWQGMPNSKDSRFERSGILWKVEDQRFVSDRPDVLVFQTEPLEESVEVTGEIIAKLFASTTGTDADWVVKLIDVYPENYPEQPEMGGYQLMIADDVLRGKFRNSYSNPSPLKPKEPELMEIDLRTRNHLFRQGHRIMVQIQSSWFPLIDRNPQTFVDIPNATAADYKKATHRIYCTPDLPSHIEMSVVR